VVSVFGDGDGDILTMQMINCKTTNPYGDKILRPISGEAMKCIERTSKKLREKP
jgi:hypothetical protein